MKFTLRPYQESAAPALRQAYAQGHRRIVYCLATGGGKTAISTGIFISAVAKGSRCLFITPRISLVRQTQQVFIDNGLDPSVLWAGDPAGFSPHKNLQLICAQTLARRIQKEGFIEALGKPQFIMVDECHLTVSDKYQSMIRALLTPETALIGLTATPWAKGASQLYEKIVSTVTPSELRDQGYLVPCRIVTGDIQLDLSKLKVTAGEYNEKDVQQAVQQTHIYADILKTYKDFTDGLRGIFFCAGKVHADALCTQFVEAGYPSAVVVAETPPETRDHIFEECRAGRIKCLFSVDALSEGLDIPQVEVVALCKPTKSLNKYIQRVGRGARKADGKISYWILDFVGCVEEHGSPYDPRTYSFVSDKPKKSKASDTEDTQKTTWHCRSCRGINEHSAMSCHVCGEKRPKPPPMTIESLGLPMKERTDAGATVLQALTAERQQAMYGALVGYMEDTGRKPGAAMFAWKEFFGNMPSRSLRLERGKHIPDIAPMISFYEKRVRAFNIRKRYAMGGSY